MGVIHIIDDDDLYRKVIVEVIRAFGFSTSEFSSGCSYLQHMRGNQYKPPQMIFSDMNMPGITGLDTLTQVLNRHPGIPCYLITANPTQFKRINLSEYAIKGVLEKPVCFEKLRGLLPLQ